MIEFKRQKRKNSYNSINICLKSLKFFLEIKEKILNLLIKMFLLRNKNSELMDVRSFDATAVSHFVKAEPLDKNFILCFQKKFQRI